LQVANGGELFDRIVERGHYSEKDAAAAFRVMVGVIAHCHNMGVMHRDIKPEVGQCSVQSYIHVLPAFYS
jgi:calcium-dependent protein kinase